VPALTIALTHGDKRVSTKTDDGGRNGPKPKAQALGKRSVSELHMNRSLVTVLSIVLLGGPIVSFAGADGLKIVVDAGEDSVNIVRQKTAVQPVVEVRDRNDVPVAGASVVFKLTGNAARFATKATNLTVTTDAAGRATTTGLQAVGKGAVQIQGQATYQGEVATATIGQTNFATVAEAAKAGRAASGSQSGTNGASQAVAQGSNHIGLIAAGAGAAVGGVVAKSVLTHHGCYAESDAMLASEDPFISAVDNYAQCLLRPGGACTALRVAAYSAISAVVNTANIYCACGGGTSTTADIDAELQYIETQPAFFSHRFIDLGPARCSTS